MIYSYAMMFVIMEVEQCSVALVGGLYGMILTVVVAEQRE